MSNRLSSVFPRPRASDPDDVVWTLQTAAVQWQRGLRADAIVWVRKAADTATQLGMTARAEELRDNAAGLAEYLWSDPEDEARGTEPLETSHPRPLASGSDEDIIELDEVDAYELELSDENEVSETELTTPDDAVDSISPEELASYRDSTSEQLARYRDSSLPPQRILPPRAAPESPAPERVLPDDLDLRSDSERAGPAEVRSSLPRLSPAPEPATISSLPTAAPPPHASFISAVPELDETEEDELLADSEFQSVPAPARSAPPPRASFSPSSMPPSSVPAGPSEGPPAVDGQFLEMVEVLADLPEEAQTELASTATLGSLRSGEAFVLSEGVLLITQGSAHVTLPQSDVSAERVRVGAVVAARGSMEGVSLRLIADGAMRFALWTDAQLERAMRDCPWVADDLRLCADRYQAHASAGLGPLGQRLDDTLRAAVYERLEVRVLSPRESVAERGKPLKGLFVVAMGELEVVNGAAEHRIGSGEFVFPGCVIGAAPAPADVRAGPNGGLVLFATRPVAHELMMSVPPLLEILAS